VTPLLPALPVDAATLEARRRAIHQTALQRLGTAHFIQLTPAEMQHWFASYDALFFAGMLEQTLQACRAPLQFSYSSRLTRSGGLTKQFRPRRTRAVPRMVGARYEIVLSRTLLLNSFADVQRPVVVNGLLCHDRLDAALRIFEHELIHLAEMLEWGRSSCDRPPFRESAHALFGHTATRHQLVMPHEHARVVSGLKIGDRVQFDYEGNLLAGIINRITQRATVLVEHPRGVRYRDGRRYQKYYVPLGLLKPV
jgi:hypothetical protein